MRNSTIFQTKVILISSLRQEVSDGDTQNKPARNLCLFYAHPMENRTKDRAKCKGGFGYPRPESLCKEKLDGK